MELHELLPLLRAHDVASYEEMPHGGRRIEFGPLRPIVPSPDPSESPEEPEEKAPAQIDAVKLALNLNDPAFAESEPE